MAWSDKTEGRKMLDRLKYLLDQLGISQTALADAGVASLGGISMWFVHGAMPTGMTMIRLAHFLASRKHNDRAPNFNWVMTGQGVPFIGAVKRDDAFRMGALQAMTEMDSFLVQRRREVASAPDASLPAISLRGRHTVAKSKGKAQDDNLPARPRQRASR